MPSLKHWVFIFLKFQIIANCYLCGTQKLLLLTRNSILLQKQCKHRWGEGGTTQAMGAEDNFYQHNQMYLGFMLNYPYPCRLEHFVKNDLTVIILTYGSFCLPLHSTPQSHIVGSGHIKSFAFPQVYQWSFSSWSSSQTMCHPNSGLYLICTKATSTS